MTALALILLVTSSGYAGLTVADRQAAATLAWLFVVLFIIVLLAHAIDYKKRHSGRIY